MWLPSECVRTARGSSSIPWLLKMASLATVSQAISFTSVPDSNLDVSQLGQMGFAGDFSGLSLYQFEGQSEDAFSSNGSSQLMTSLPDGVMLNLADSDATIESMCMFQGMVILGGNFTSVGGKESTAVAAFNPNTSEVTPLAGLSGQVNSLLCDDDMVYVGGSFKAADSLNAITWLATSSWASLPFAGFNGPVTSITKASTGHIIFGGSFTGLGNTSAPAQQDGQTINLSTANISTYQGSSTTGFSDPKNIVCNTNGTDGAGNTWLLEDSVPGNLEAQFGFHFTPSKLRLRNTHQDGRGTKTWSFTAQPNNGLMNFTYLDPTTGQNMSCTNACPLSNDTSVEYQDFRFVNSIDMNAFRFNIYDWYGAGGGLDGLELFEDGLFSYAIDDFNEPACSNSSTPSKATSTGPWSVTPAGNSQSEYLTAVLSPPIASDAATVVFFPDVIESGDYVIKIFTPGCQQDGTCSSRGQINVFGNLNSSSGTQQLNSNQPIYQTNEFDKYDVIFTGYVAAATSSFRPSITLSPVAGQALSSSALTLVAQSVGLEQMNSSGGLNGLFEWNPTQSTVNPSDFDTSAFDKLGSSFSSNSNVSSLAVSGDTVYIGGNFTASGVSNVVGINGNGQTLPLSGGLNGQVLAMYNTDSQLFVGGVFSNTEKADAIGLSNIAVYNQQSQDWTALGAGVNGAVHKVVPITLNLTGGTSEEAITFSGEFTQILAFGNGTAFNTAGFAIWVTSQNNWLQNLETPMPLLEGFLSTSLLDVSSNVSLYAGSISSQSLRADGVASAGNTLSNFPITFASSTNSSNTASERSTLTSSTKSISGIVTGAFDTNNQRNITILAGNFIANATNGSVIHNLAFIDRHNSDNVTGLGTELPADSAFLALALDGDTLFAGGQLNGTIQGSSVDGLISYNLASGSFNTQPPVLAGDNVVVNSIAAQPDSSNIYVGGSFSTAGSLPCPGLCVLDPDSNQWSRPGFGLDGTVNTLLWSSSSLLFIGGQLTINNTDVYLASYDASKSSWAVLANSSTLPGPVQALTAADEKQDQVWAAGSSNGTVYLMKYDGKSWASANLALDSNTVINSLQMFTLTKNHDQSDLIEQNEALLLTGSIGIPGFGTASAAIYNGTTIQPYALTSSMKQAAGPGSISKIFVEKQNFFNGSSSGHLAVGLVVLIALAISLGLIALIVAAGLALDRYRKKRDGYIPAPTSMFDRGNGMQRIPPHDLLNSLSKGRAAPTV
ncbi:cellular morphogenesis protein [Xylariaceae sp. FL0255]|nr:cellular morphogenesis protein [Xylariaceae sp. FL0255]